MAAAFGLNPYVIIQKYNTGKTCADAELSGITAYLADGKCHKTDVAKSYRAARKADGSATVQSYTDATCGTLGTTVAVNAADGAAHTCVSDSKFYGDNATPLYLTSTMNYDTTANTCSSGVPSLVSTAVANVDTTCATTSSCTGVAAPYTGTKCSSASSYLTDMTTAFGLNPYVIIQKYNTGKSCADAELSGITAYLADGKCHKTDAAKSYRAARKADGSATVLSYTDAVCGTLGTTVAINAADGAAHTCVSDSKFYGDNATPLYLTTTMNYDTTANTCSSGVPSFVSTAVANIDTTCSTTSGCTGVAAPFTGTKCSSAVSYQNDMAAAFGVNPYIILQKYNTGKACADGELSGITTYLADGKCHKTGATASYRATRSADNSASIKTYTDAVCGTGETVTAVTASQGTNNGCTTDTKVFGAGTTPLYLSSTVNYDTTTNTCKSGLPSLVTSTVVPVDACSATTTCTGQAAPYTGTSCSSTLTYKDDMIAAFGVNPYVIVEKYTAGQSCAADKLSGITTYLADGKCHKTGATASYRATRSADNSASIKTYTDAVCGTGETVTAVTASQGTNNGCTTDTKVFGAGTTPLYLSSTVNYDTTTNTCKSGLPSLVTSTVVPVDACSATTTCTGQAAPYTGTSCSSTQTYKDDMIGAFGVNPYVIVEKYTAGQSCAVDKLSGITTYLADGKCHKTGATASYRATRSADNSASIKTYTDAVCGTGETVTAVTVPQGTNNGCYADTKVFGAGTTPLYLSSTVNYDTTTNTCKSGLPSLVTSTVVPVDSCSATTTCTGQAAPYTGTSCSSTLTYKPDMATAFGANPYVIVEKFTAGQSCAADKLSGITTYLADGKCHKTGATASYRTTRSADNSASIKTYTDAVCGTGETVTAVTVSQGTNNGCYADTKVFGAGTTPLYLSSTVNYDTTTNTCKSGLPSLVTSTVVPVDACSATTTCTGQAAPYTGTSCSSTLTYKDDMIAAFGVNPYVIVEKYTAGQSCAADKLSGITTYLADGKCHKSSSTASYRVTRSADNSISIKTYTDAVCGTGETVVTVTALQTANSCAADTSGIVDTKVYYGGSATPLYLTSTMQFDSTTNSCKTGVPSLVTSAVVAVDACSATTTCTGQAAPYTGTSCSSTLTYKPDMATAFGVNPYVIVEKYTAGQSCAADKLSGITTYLADGKCHKTGATASYRTTRSADNSASIKTYTDAVCGTGETVTAVTASQGTNNGCTSDTKVFGAGTTPLYLSSTVNYDTTTNTCKSGLPSLVTSTVVPVDSCSATTTCTGQAAPYTGTSCSSTLTYKDDMIAAFGVNPYVIVEKYTAGQSCAADKLSGITTYLADGKCHKLSSTTSYRAVRSADNSAAIQPYTDATCGTAGSLLTVSSTDGTSNACSSDTKIYGAGVTPLYLVSTVNYDTNANSCKLGLPTYATTAVGTFAVCVPSSICTGQSAPYTGTSCSSTLTYKDDMAAAFGPNPYLIVEKYTAGQSCAADKLSGITAYLANGKCHKTSATTSYRATRKGDGSATVKIYTDAICGTGETVTSVTAPQGTNNACTADSKVYGAGKTPFSTLTFKDDMAGAFGSNPYVIVEKYNSGQSCAAGELSAVTTYLADGKCHKTDLSTSYRATRKVDGSAIVQLYSDAMCGAAGSQLTVTAAQGTDHSCGTVSSYKADMAAAFSLKPYVIVKKYNTGKKCAAMDLSGITTYLADGSCHKTGTSTSYAATRSADGSANIQSYTDAVCGAVGTRLTVTAAQTANSCAADGSGIADTKVYGSGKTEKVYSSTFYFDTNMNSCQSGLPTQVVTVKADVGGCPATTTCTGQAAPYTGTKCGSTLAYKDEWLLHLVQIRI
ncbi:hypothetical protein PInf_002892 [Phytophthora infestans]|nr:hypothetical protein PInf_002892 [Phytophthora infestans]